MTEINNLITDNIDVWTSAIKKRNATGRGSSKKIELTGIKKLRELILELAVRGKLVPQDASDEPASVLLDKIAEDKVQLIADKKIKKQKPLPAITDEEKPFELPRGWEWCRLGDFGEVKGGKRLPKGHTLLSTKTDHAYIRVTDMKNGSVNLNGLQYLSTDTQELISQYTISKEDLYITIAGTIGEIGSIPAELDGMNLTENAAKIVFRQIELLWLKQSLSSSFAMNQFMDKMNQLAQPKLALHRILSSIIALPPLTEQQRIVAKVDELMVLCDQLEQQTEQSLSAHQTLVEVLLAALTESKDVNDFQTSWQRIAEHFDVLFTTEHSIEQLKQTILQLAVMGKLVPQNPSDEPACVLLEKIAEEKAQLIADKKIKKQKPLPAIIDDEKLFELPSGWEYERIGTFGIVGTGSTPSRSNPDYWQPAEYNWVSSGETSEFFVNETKEKVSALAIKETNVSLYPAGTLIVAMYGQGKTRGQITELLDEAGTNQACAAIRLVNDSKHHKDYVKLYFRKAYVELRSHAAGGAQPNLNVGKISNTVLALPPLAEQQRIVVKVGELMALCEQLKARLSDAQTTQHHLAVAVVENALSSDKEQIL